MPPGRSFPAKPSFAVARKLLNAQDKERLACAFLKATQTVNVSAPRSQPVRLANENKFDAVKAAREFGGVELASFKRSIWVITKKIKDHMAGGDMAIEAPAKTNGAGRKRKTTDDVGQGRDGGEGNGMVEASSKKARRGAAKKARGEASEGLGADGAGMENEGAVEEDYELV